MEEEASILYIRHWFSADQVFAKYPISRLESEQFFMKTDVPCIAKFFKQTMKNPNVEDIGRMICVAIAYSAINKWQDFIRVFSVPFLQTFNKLKKMDEENYKKYLDIVKNKIDIIWKFPFFWCVHYSHVPNHLDRVNLKVALKDIDFVLLMFRQFPDHQQFKLWTIYHLCEKNKIEKWYHLITDLPAILESLTIKTRNFMPYIWYADRFCKQLDKIHFWKKFLSLDARITMDKLQNPAHNYYMYSFTKITTKFWWENYELLSETEKYRIFTIYSPSRKEVEKMTDKTRLILAKCLYMGVVNSRNNMFFTNMSYIFDLMEKETVLQFIASIRKSCKTTLTNEILVKYFPFLEKFII